MDTDPRIETSRNESGLERLAERFLEYLRTRTSEHWVMFLAGLVIGALVA